MRKLDTSMSILNHILKQYECVSQVVAWATDAIQQRVSFICLLIYLLNVFDLLLRVRQCAESSKRDQSRRVCFEEFAVQRKEQTLLLSIQQKCVGHRICAWHSCIY